MKINSLLAAVGNFLRIRFYSARNPWAKINQRLWGFGQNGPKLQEFPVNSLLNRRIYGTNSIEVWGFGQQNADPPDIKHSARGVFYLFFYSFYYDLIVIKLLSET